MNGNYINLGDEVKDIVTGFRGKVIAKCAYMYRPDEFGVQPTSKGQQNQMHKLEWLVASRLVHAAGFNDS